MRLRGYLPVPGRPNGSRAVMRVVGPGDLATCATCGADISYRVRTRGQRRVVCNVYQGGMWRRVEHHHLGCYQAAGRPYGTEIDLRD